MIEYVDRLLAHWAQEFSVRDGGLALGCKSGWSQGLMTELGNSSGRRVTARGTASRPTQARSGVGKVAERVNQAVERLPEHLQTAIRVKYVDEPGSTGAEIATILGVPTSTFHRHMHSAHLRLSEDLPTSFVHWKLKSPQGS